MRYYFTTWKNGMISTRYDADSEREAARGFFTDYADGAYDLDDPATNADGDLGFDSEDVSRHDFGLMMKARGYTAFAFGVFRDLDESGWTLWSKP